LVLDHPDAADGNTTPCRACHGTDYRGTVLSVSQDNRTLSTPFGTKSFWNGFKVGCYNCHLGPRNSDTNPNRAPVANNTAATTTAGASVSINLVATDADNNPLTLRIISQPAHGTTALAGTVAVYFPEPDYIGADSFTFAANDGSTDSNLATVSITVGVSPCSLTCNPAAPAGAAVNAPVSFAASTTSSGCSTSVSYEWDFGDGSLHSTAPNPSHAYTTADTFRWTMTAHAGPASCTGAGELRTTTTPLRAPYLLEQIKVTTNNQGRDLSVAWDSSNCPSAGYHIVYGYGSGLKTWTLAGGVCSIGTSGSVLWASTPDPRGDPSRLLWFLVVGDDGFATEGSWGVTSAGAERGGAAPSAVCGIAVKNTTGYCAAP
jgi:hypothetical protein